MAASRAIVILGDDVSLGQGCAPGDSYVDIVERAVSSHGVQVHNWSRQEMSAVGVGSEPEDVQAQLRGLVSQCFDAVVVIALGNHDRALGMDEVYDQYLEAVVRMCQNENAKAIILQVVPAADPERSVAKATGSRYVPSPQSAMQQHHIDPALPFLPHPPVHADIASMLLQALEQEMDLPLSGAAGHAAARQEPKERKAKTRESPLDGVWKSQESGEVVAIRGEIISSHDGRETRIVRIGPDTWAIAGDHGQQIEAQVVDGRIIWTDGDIWNRHDEGHSPQLEKPPEKKRMKTDLRALKKLWDAAEEACNRTRVEESKQELLHERETLSHERERLQARRTKYEAGRQHQHEETEKLSALRAG